MEQVQLNYSLNFKKGDVSELQKLLEPLKSISQYSKDAGNGFKAIGTAAKSTNTNLSAIANLLLKISTAANKAATDVNKMAVNSGKLRSNLGKTAVATATIKKDTGAASKSVSNITQNSVKLKANANAAAKSFQQIQNAANTTKVPDVQKPSGTSPIPSTIPDSKGLVNAAFGFNQIFSAATAATAAVNQFLQPYVQLDKEIQNIGTLGRAEYQEFTKYAGDIAAEIPGQANDVANGFYQAISAFGTRADQFTNEQIANFVKISAKAAVAGQSTVTAAVDVGTSILNAYGKDADEAVSTYDAVFAAIKLGKTSFEEINQAIPQVVPSAAAAGVAFEQVAASLSSLTAKGTPTAQAATQLNAVFTLLSKGNVELEKALAQSGQTLTGLQEDLKKPVAEGGGLQAVLEQIRNSVEATGQTFGAKFTGRVEAAKTILQLTGDAAEETRGTFAALENEIAGGAAEKAFGVAAQSISAQTDAVLSTLQNKFNAVFATIGTGATTALNSFIQLSPAIQGVGAAAGLLPFGKIFGAIGTGAKTASSLIVKFIPILGGLTTAFTAMGTSAAASWAAALGPIAAVAAAIAGIIGLTVLIVKKWDYVKAGIAGIFEGINNVIKGYIQGWKDTINAFASGDILGGIAGIFKSATPAGIAIEGAKNFGEGFKEGLNESLAGSSDVVNKRLDEITNNLNDTEVKLKATADFDNLLEQYKTTVDDIAKLKAIPEGSLTEQQIKDLEALEAKAQQAANRIAKIDLSTIAEGGVSSDIVDGKLVTNYEILIDKAEEFSETQKKLNEEQSASNFEAYNKEAGNLVNIYKQQGNEIQSLIQERAKLIESGDLEKAQKVEEEINEKVGEQTKNRERLVTLYQQTVNLSDEEIEANNEIAKTLKLSEKITLDTASGQQKIVNLLEKSSEEAKVFSDSLGAAKDKQEELVNALAATIKEQEDGQLTTVEQVSLKEKEKALIEAINEQTKEINKSEAALNKAKALTGLLKAKEKKTSKDLNKLLQEEFKLIEKTNNTLLETQNIQAEATRLSQRREANSLDELAALNRQGEALKSNLNELQRIYAISEGGEIGVNIKDSQKQQVIDQFKSLQNEIAQLANERTEIQISIEADEAELKAAEEAFTRRQIEWEIQVGLKDEEDIKPILEKERDDLQAEINKINSQLEVAIANNQTALAAEYRKALSNVKNEYQAVTFQILELEIAKNKELTELNKEQSESRIKIAEETAEAEATVAQKAIENTTNSTIDALNKQTTAKLNKLSESEQKQTDLVTSQEEERIAKIDNLKDQGLLSDIAYENQKTAIQKNAEEERLKIAEEAAKKKAAAEEKARNEELIANSLQRGALIQLENATELKKAEAKQKELEDRKAFLLQNAELNKAELAEVEKQLSDVAKTIKDKGDLMVVYGDVIKQGISDTLGDLFAGNAEAAKDSFKEVLAVMAGAIEKAASAAVTQLILGQLAITGLTTGIAGIFTVPAITALVRGAIGALIRPVVNNLLSFSTGGEVSSPTMAIIGDAKKSGNASNREWVFNSRNIKQLTGAIISDYTKHQSMQKDMIDVAKTLKLARQLIVSDTYRQNITQNYNNVNDNTATNKRLDKLLKENIEMKQLMMQGNKYSQATQDNTYMGWNILKQKDFSPTINTGNPQIVRVKSARKRRN